MATQLASDQASDLAIDYPGQSDFDGPPGGYAPVSRLRRQYLDYIGSKQAEIEEQKSARQYYHGAHWTADEVRILRRRRQPVITYNRVARKLNSIVGLVERLRQDPKAYPRNPSKENGAEIATQSIRAVLDASSWQFVSSEVSRHGGIDGFSGIELKLTDGDHGDPDIVIALVFGDDYFYDPRSYKYDFSDGTYQGIAKWLDEDVAVDLFPDKEDEIRALIEYGSDLTTNADREFKWVMVNERRVRLVEHWYLRNGVWCWAFYIGDILLDQGISPFIDDRKKTFCRFIMFSAAVDHDADRYGFIRNMKGPQDEINQRRSKALHISNSRRIIAEKGAFTDVEKARAEWSKPDGVLEFNRGFQAKPDETQADLAAQMEFLQEAKQEIESMANVTPTTLQGELPKNISGRAINLLQQGATAELGPFVLAYRDWKLRVYRAIWFAIKQYWTSERWVRINDANGDFVEFMQINGMDMNQSGEPAIVNFVGGLDVEIVLDEGPDVINMMADAYDQLAGLPPGTIPPKVLVMLMPIQGSLKKQIIQELSQTDPTAEMAKHLAVTKEAADIDKTNAEVVEKRAQALRHVAQAAHAASEAHLNASHFVTAGMGIDPVGTPLDRSQPETQPAPQGAPQPNVPA